jgi:hypothetical protein
MEPDEELAGEDIPAPVETALEPDPEVAPAPGAVLKTDNKTILSKS